METIRDIWRRRRWIGLITFAAVAVTVVSLVTSLPDLYRATASVLVERHQVPENFVRSSVTGELDTRLQTISQEVLSRARLETLITRFDLYQAARQRAPIEAVVDGMRKDIGIEIKSVEQPTGRSTVAFAVSYRGRDPQIVAAVTNALATSYVEENVRLRDQQASSTAGFLRTQLTETKVRLDEQEQRVREFRTRWGGQLPQQLAVNLATLERLHTQLHLVSANQLRAQDRRASLDKQLADLDPRRSAGAVDSGPTRLAKMRRDLAELRSRYTDRYPDVARLRADIAKLDHELRFGDPSSSLPAPPSDPAVDRLRASIRDADDEINGLKAEERRLQGDIEAYQRRVESAPEREQELKELSRDYDATRELYASLLKRYEDAQLAETMEQRQRGEQFRVLDPAVAPTEPVAPNRPRLLLTGVALAIGLAVAAMVLGERLDTSFHSVEDLRALTTAPVLVSIPLIVTATDRWRGWRRFGLGAAATVVVLALTVKTSQYLAHGNEWLVGLLSRGGL